MEDKKPTLKNWRKFPKPTIKIQKASVTKQLEQSKYWLEEQLRISCQSCKP